MNLDARQARARFRNELIAQRSARALEKRNMEYSHISRLEQSKMAATSTESVMTARWRVSAVVQPSSMRDNRSMALIDVHLRERRALSEHQVMLMQQGHGAKLIVSRPLSASYIFTSHAADSLEAFRPPPVKVPADEMIYYLS